MLRAACIGLAAIVVTARPAYAYEFWLRAQSFGQAYQLRDYQLVGPDLFLGRRRFTETLALRVFDIGDLSKDRRIAHMPDHGLRISWQSYIRVDHDFGDYTSGSITLPGPMVRDAIDVIPELSESADGLELMFGFLQLDGMFDDRLSLQIGRVLADDGWGTTAVDGVAGRYELPVPVAVSASAGLRVRASSPLGVSSYELDGTSGAGCQEYVEGPTAGTGTWQLIDRNRVVANEPLASDVAYCPQRDVDQPTIGFSVATSRIHGFGAELGYRRTWSDTVGGLYPNEFGQAPSTGVDEERVYARVHGELHAGDLAFEPYADARYSILNAVFDQRRCRRAVARRRPRMLEPSLEYFYPDVRRRLDLQRVLDRADHRCAARVSLRLDRPVARHRERVAASLRARGQHDGARGRRRRRRSSARSAAVGAAASMRCTTTATAGGAPAARP